MPYHSWKCASRLFSVVWISLKYLDAISCKRKVLSEGHKITLRIGISWTHTLPFLISTSHSWLNEMIILSKVREPDNNESQKKSLKLSFFYIWSFYSSVVGCESFLESNSPNFLALYETNFEEWIYLSNFFVRGYLPSLWMDSVTHMLGLANLQFM